MRKKKRGFTLIELIVAMAVLGIAMAAAVPSFQGMIARNRIATQVNDMILAINLARSEAMRIGSTVSVVGASPANTADEFGGGFCVATGAPSDCSGTTVLRRWPELAGADTTFDLVDAGGAVRIEFSSRGGVRNFSQQAQVDLCYPGQDGRRIHINLIGRSKSHRPGDPDANKRPDC